MEECTGICLRENGIWTITPAQYITFLNRKYDIVSSFPNGQEYFDFVERMHQQVHDLVDPNEEMWSLSTIKPPVADRPVFNGICATIAAIMQKEQHHSYAEFKNPVQAGVVYCMDREEIFYDDLLDKNLVIMLMRGYVPTFFLEREKAKTSRLYDHIGVYKAKELAADIGGQ